MKKLSILALAAAGLLLGACSDKNEVAQEVQNPVGEFDDGAYIGISIQMPKTTATTRANENFKDGDSEEWEVKDANLLIFKGASETDAKYVATYALDIPAVIDPEANTNVEATLNKATQIDNYLAAEMTSTSNTAKYFAYVIVNANGQVPALVPDKTLFKDFRALEFDQIGAPIAAKCNIGNGGLLMTNAPVCNYPGGATAPTKGSGESAPDVAYTTLVEIAKNKIFSTKAQAETAGNEAACVYVERAAVKITVSTDATKYKGTLGNITDNTNPAYETISILGWQIVNYEPTYFNTRKVEASWGALASDYTPTLTSPHLYRFVSPTAFAPTIPGAHSDQPFRTYWAEDVNYNNGTALERPQADINGAWIGAGESGYTTENTFDVEHQTWENTTQVTIKVQFNGGTGFYIVDGNDGKLANAAAKTQLETNLKGLLPVQNAFTELVKDLPALSTGEYKLVVTVSLTDPTVGTNDATYTATTKVTANESDYVIPADETAGDNPKKPTTKFNALVEAVNAGISNYKAKFYLNGIAYYNARIKHFGDVETPWSAAAPWKVIMPGTTVEQIYGFGNNSTKALNGETVDNSDKRFLGRYGVVRDNWYDLVIDEISELGDAEPLNVTGNSTPDDVVKNYISVHVHIIPWVLRTQHISF